MHLLVVNSLMRNKFVKLDEWLMNKLIALPSLLLGILLKKNFVVFK